MIHVLANIRVKAGKRDEYLAILNTNVLLVRAEAGCLEYQPTVDVPTGLAAQRRDPNRVVLIEKWESLDALKAHLAAPHMEAYRRKVKDLVEEAELTVTASV